MFYQGPSQTPELDLAVPVTGNMKSERAHILLYVNTAATVV